MTEVACFWYLVTREYWRKIMKYRSFRILVLGRAYLEENKLEEAVPVRVISWAKLRLIAKPNRISV